MAKRLSEKQKEEIIYDFINGKTVDQLSIQFECSKLTIIRNLKKSLGDNKYKLIIRNTNNSKNSSQIKEKNISIQKKYLDNLEAQDHKNNFIEEKNITQPLEDEVFINSQFMELTPINYDIENVPQKDFSSLHISSVEFPKIVFMIVDKKIELETKYLKDYPDWQFLSPDELSRKTIEIYSDLKIAKNFCNKEQKVIKITNTDVFKITAQILLSRGISRIVSGDQLIAL